MRFISLFFLIGALAMCAVAFNAVRQLDFTVSTPKAPSGNFIQDRLDAPLSASGPAKRFVVHQGETAGDIADRLEREGLIRSAFNMRLIARIGNIGSDLKAGEYELRPSMRPSEIMAIMKEGRYGGAILTVPEGWRIAEIADTIDRQGLARRPDFLDALTRTQASRDFLSTRPAGNGLEGYLFPDTYRVPIDQTMPGLVNEMLDNFGRQVTPVLRERAAKRGLTLHQTITLASIVEREARLAEERPRIAGVFHARLKRNMLLQADPTVQFALIPGMPASPISGGYWKFALTTTDLQIDSPYNTYRRTGLPPGPICNPGLAAIVATIDAPETEELFFVARTDGSHAFARTLAEHNANVSRFQLTPTSSPR